MKPVNKTILILLIFSIAMGFMESAVVVYLRALYYPDGFIFPLVPLDNRLLLTELLREAATLIMLLTIAIIAGKNFVQRFALPWVALRLPNARQAGFTHGYSS